MHRFAGAIACPGLHWYASANSGMFRIVPITRYFPGECGSLFARCNRSCSVLFSHHTCAKPRKKRCSGVMVGIGEEMHELLDVFRDLAAIKVDILTVGQYLRPSKDHLPLTRYYTPNEFLFMKEEALKMGFRHVESGPLVRSSYHAHEQAASTGLV